MAYQLVNLTTCKPYNRQFRQRVESVKARVHNAPLRVITPLVLRVSASLQGAEVAELGHKKSCRLEARHAALE